MMKKGIIFGTLLLALVAFVGTGFAGNQTIDGSLVKIDGAMYTVKNDKGDEKTIHVDPKSTKKTGDLKTGTKVQAEVDSSGHALWIKVVEMEKE